MADDDVQHVSIDDLLNGSPEEISEAKPEPKADPEPKSESTTPEAKAEAGKAEEAKEEAKEEGTGDDKDETPSSEELELDGQKVVPVRALTNERQKRQDLEKELEALKLAKPEGEAKDKVINSDQDKVEFPPRPDEFDDPEGAAEWDTKVAEAKAWVEKCEASRETLMLVKDDYEEVEAAFNEAAQKDDSLRAKLYKSANPAAFAYKQGKQIMAQKEAEDPEALKSKLKAEIVAELKEAGLLLEKGEGDKPDAKAKDESKPAENGKDVVLPESLADVASTKASPAAERVDHTPLDEILPP